MGGFLWQRFPTRTSHGRGGLHDSIIGSGNDTMGREGCKEENQERNRRGEVDVEERAVSSLVGGPWPNGQDEIREAHLDNVNERTQAPQRPSSTSPTEERINVPTEASGREDGFTSTIDEIQQLLESSRHGAARRDLKEKSRERLADDPLLVPWIRREKRRERVARRGPVRSRVEGGKREKGQREWGIPQVLFKGHGAVRSQVGWMVVWRPLFLICSGPKVEGGMAAVCILITSITSSRSGLSHLGHADIWSLRYSPSHGYPGLPVTGEHMVLTSRHLSSTASCTGPPFRSNSVKLSTLNLTRLLLKASVR